jgi:hypothetical protein
MHAEALAVIVAVTAAFMLGFGNPPVLLSENNLWTGSNICSQVPEWARYLDILTD